VDHTLPDSYPGFLIGEGNDLSCRYGIHFESRQEFNPPKVQMFADLLARALPQITTHRVVLERFDVYYNHRLEALGVLASGESHTVLGDELEKAAHQNQGLYFSDKLLIDTNPEVDRHPTKNQVGCTNSHEGEYYSEEISGGYDVVVSWFEFSVDGHPYEFRTFYQLQPKDKAAIASGINEAIRMSVEQIAKKIKL
jgi:hypothetical protein